MFFFTLFLVATLVTFIFTPFIIHLAKRYGFVDLPNRPHPAILHKVPIPRAGGLAIFLGIILTFILLYTPEILDRKILGVGLACALVVAVGVLDDKFDINPYFRLFSNFLAVLIVVYFGVGISSFTNPLGGIVNLEAWQFSFTIPTNLPFAGTYSIFLLGQIFAFLWIIWVMNAINWSSGVDGQLSGIAFISLSILGFVALRSLPSDSEQLLIASLSFIAAGAFLGFLPWSFYPQKIMPGYGGATLAGFLIATLSIMSGAKLATAVLVLAVPFVDGLWAISRRVYSHRSPVWGDKKHLHHLLLARGWTVPQVAFFYYLAASILGISALALNSRGKLFALVMVAIIILGIIITVSVTRTKSGKL